MERTCNNRILWVDEVKVIACILVVLGHFLQSMTKAGILPATDLYRWFDQTIYYFHVQLFFICSGFLYQRCSRVDNVQAWLRNVMRKVRALGVPYLFFSVVTWLLKTMFADSVNEQIGGLGSTLFLHPVSPYWYLYCLFCIFLITPTFRGAATARTYLIIAVVAKAVVSTVGGTQVYAISSTMTYLVWFVIGMWIAYYDMRLTGRRGPAYVCAIVFLAGSIVAYACGFTREPVPFVLGLLACAAVILMTAEHAETLANVPGVSLLSAYTLPIYLMHTLCAAPVRTVLIRLGWTSAIVHVVVGLTASIVGPMMIVWCYRQLRTQLRLHEH